VHFVANILLALGNATEKPAEATSRGFDDIPWIESIEQGVYPHWTTLVVSIGIGRIPEIVGLVREGKDMQNSKAGHLNC
jgi:hypothetical protein